MSLRKRRLLMVLLFALVAVFAAVPAAGVGAQDAVVLQVAVPEFMRNFLPDDTFAQFEADNPGVTVKDGVSSVGVMVGPPLRRVVLGLAKFPESRGDKDPRSKEMATVPPGKVLSTVNHEGRLSTKLPLSFAACDIS